MSTRNDDRDRDRSQRNYGRRSRQDYDRSYESGQSGWGSAFGEEDQRYAGESRGPYGTGRAMYGGGGDYQSRDWGSEGEGDRYSSRYGGSGRGYSGGEYGGSSAGEYSGREYGGRSSRMGSEYGGSYGRRSSSMGGYGGSSYGDEFGSSYGGGWERGEGRFRDTQAGSGYSQGSSYPRSERSGERGRYSSEYGRSGYGQGYGARGGYEGRGGYGGYSEGREYEGRGGYGSYGEGRGYEGRGGYGEGQERGWWDRLSDTVASWFGDEEAERRRQMERPYQGRGPKNYRRSDERIREDVNDRLSEGYLDATEIDVSVNNAEVVLSGTVDRRTDKRRAEYIAENVPGVTNVENRLRVKSREQYGSAYETSEGTSTMGTTGSTGTTGTGTGPTGSTGTTGTTGTTSTSATGSTTGSTSTSSGGRGKSASGGQSS
jgi:osmotically-inducible protein OsmY